LTWRGDSDGSRALVIVAAINGGMQPSRGATKVPVSPDEIAEAAEGCRTAGAAIVHFHARDANGQPSSDPALYAEIIAAVRARTDVLLQTTNGAGVRRDAATGRFLWPPDEERLALMQLESGPDVYCVGGGTVDMFNPAGGYPDEVPYINSADYVKSAIAAAHANGKPIELEVIVPSIADRLARYADEGVFDRDASVWLQHAGGMGTAANARSLIFSVEEARRLFPNAIWGAIAVGDNMFRLGTLAIALGADVARVGFEDGLLLPDGSQATTNDEQVEAIASIARIYGRGPATPQQAREILGIDGG
jgi:3-keto-5-aminohexanoate cleavage enzyme